MIGRAYPHTCPNCSAVYESTRRSRKAWPCSSCSVPNRSRIRVLLPTGPEYGSIIGQTPSNQTLAIRMDNGDLIRAKRYGTGSFFATSDEGRKYLVEVMQ